MLLNKLLNYVKHNLIPQWIKKEYYSYLAHKEYLRVSKLPENCYEEYLTKRYAEMMNRNERTYGLTMDFDNPITYSQKQQWMKLYDVNDTMVQCSDKYAVREYIKAKIGEEYLIPLISINGKDRFENSQEIDFSKLPEKFVLKCNHGSHYNIIVTNKSSLSNRKIRKLKRQLNFWLKEKYEFKVGMELYYKGIKPYIIIEQYMEMDGDLPDYKFYCFDGKVEFLLCMQNRFSGLRQSCLDLNFSKMPFLLPTGTKVDYEEVTIGKPANFEKMTQIAQKLCIGFSHVRVDLYNINDKIYFGELTFCSSSGYDVAYPSEYDKFLGDKIQLDLNKRNEITKYRNCQMDS